MNATKEFKLLDATKHRGYLVPFVGRRPVRPTTGKSSTTPRYNISCHVTQF